MADYLLSVPLKTGYETASMRLAEVLKTEFVGEGYKKESVNGAINQFISLRVQIVQTNNLPKTQGTLELFYKYHDQLAALIEKLPKLKFIYSNVEFCWDDAFEKGGLFGRKTIMNTSFFENERLCVLFNIAALLSHLGTVSRAADTDVELKNAAKFYQTSASVFNQLTDYRKELPANATAVGTLTPDLGPEAISALRFLMLAQAQEVFIDKARKDKMKDGIVSKLCAAGADMYSEALFQLSLESVKNLWDRNCISNVTGKILALEGLANYFQSRVNLSLKQYGEQIGRLNVTIKNLKKAQGKVGGVNCGGYLADILNEAETQYASSKKDNDFIYHEVVQSSDSLTSIESPATARLAKLNTQLLPRFCTEFTDLFECAEKNSNEKSGETGSLKQIFNTAANSLGHYLVNLSGNKNETKK